MADTAIASPIKSEHSTRKNKKPLMEKRRRARINSCLSQLKSLVLQAIKKDSSQFSKLEKADILELTVKHLRALQRQQAAGVMTSDPNVVSKYRAGFNECAKEVIRYMGSVRDVNDDVKERVVGHLAGCLQVVNHVTPAESIQQQQQQQCMKPLHVHIPPQGPVNAGVATSAVILPTQGALPHTMSFTPSPVGSASPESRHSTSPVSVPAISGLSMSGVSTAPTAVISHNQQHISGAFKIVPSSACPGGAVALYLGGTSVHRGGDNNVSVDAVPLYSVALPQTDGGVTAFVPPSSTTTSVSAASHYHPASHAQPMDSRGSANVSPIRMDYTPASTSLPVDLRQKVKSSHSFMESHFPVSMAQCSPASLSDEKLWRPW